jgi:hypothetical protein
MRAFVCLKRPRSVNAKSSQKFKEFVLEAFKQFHANHAIEVGPLYGIVYYMHSGVNQLDADNLSKPIWDSLNGTCYHDDRLLRHRRAGVIDLRTTDFHAFDLSNVPDPVAEALMHAIGTEEHVVYIEYGTLDDQMFTFALEGRQVSAP